MSQTDTLTVSLTWTADEDVELDWNAYGRTTTYVISKSLVASLVNRDYKATAILEYGEVKEQTFPSYVEAKHWCLLIEAADNI